jgi:hypothetical protein
VFHQPTNAQTGQSKKTLDLLNDMQAEQLVNSSDGGFGFDDMAVDNAHPMPPQLPTLDFTVYNLAQALASK